MPADLLTCFIQEGVQPHRMDPHTDHKEVNVWPGRAVQNKNDQAPQSKGSAFNKSLRPDFL